MEGVARPEYEREANAWQEVVPALSCLRNVARKKVHSAPVDIVASPKNVSFRRPLTDRGVDSPDRQTREEDTRARKERIRVITQMFKQFREEQARMQVIPVSAEGAVLESCGEQLMVSPRHIGLKMLLLSCDS